MPCFKVGTFKIKGAIASGYKLYFYCRYKEGKEPIPQDGILKGLSVILDLHTDFLATSSVDEDFHGFVGSDFLI